MTNRALRYRSEVLGPYDARLDDPDELDPPEEVRRFVLLEEHGAPGSGGTVMATSFHSLGAVVAYREGLVYPEDWAPLFVIDLDTGARFAVVSRTTLVQEPSGDETASDKAA